MINSSQAGRSILLIALVGAVVAGCVMQAPDRRDSASMGRSTAPSPPLSESLPAPGARVPARLLAYAPGAPGAPAVPGAAAACLGQIEAFAELHSGNRVLLGPAAFATSDKLVLTRMARRGSDGRPLDGRAAPPRPLVLSLVAGPRGCAVQVAAGSAAQDASEGTKVVDVAPSSAELPACHCVPLAPVK